MPTDRKNPSRYSKIKVFLSHSWGERKVQHEFAKKICEFLKKDKELEPIIDEDRFSAGGSWKVIYEDIIEGGKAVVLLQFSKEFLNSPNCKYELDVARNAYISKGVPIIPILIEDLKLPEILKDDIYVDMKMTYKLFVDNQIDLTSEFKSKVRDIVRGIKDRIGEYENRVHIVRVVHPDDQVFLESRELFTKYPRDYRDDFESIQQWLGECSDEFLEGKYFQELYYVAHFQGKCVGVLYATYYRSSQYNDGYVVILPLVVAKGATKCGNTIVAKELLKRLKADTNTKNSNCERYLIEFPRLSQLDLVDIETCFRGWESLSKKEHLGVFQGLNYLSPDSKEFIKSGGEDYDAEPMLLLTIFRYPHRRMNKKKIRKEILDFIYGVYHAEAYSNPFYIRKWISLMDQLQQEVESSLPDECVTEYIDPKLISEKLRELEIDLPE